MDSVCGSVYSDSAIGNHESCIIPREVYWSEENIFEELDKMVNCISQEGEITVNNNVS